MPLLDVTSEIFKDVQLNNVLLIASQHILETIRVMFGSFISKGLKPENIFLIGKCYSTNDEVMKRFQNMGINVSPKSDSFDSYTSFDEQFEVYTTEFLEEIKNKVNTKKFDKVIILEDGGNLLPKAELIFEDRSNFIGIEQTSAGYERLKNIKLDFPVINVARSYTKLEIESPIIAESVLQRIELFLKNKKNKPKKVLIIGGGAIGRSLQERIKDIFEVKVFDTIRELSDFNGEVNSILKDFDMIIGCTGKNILDIDTYSYLKKDCILISASSSDREFSAVTLRKMCKKIAHCHEDLEINGLTLTNCGFPINFDGGEISAGPQDIQITLALLFSSICLAVSKKYENGLVELDKSTQERLIKEFESLRSKV